MGRSRLKLAVQCGERLAAGGRQAEHPNPDQPALRVDVNIHQLSGSANDSHSIFLRIFLASAAFAVFACFACLCFSASEPACWRWTRSKMASPMLESRIEPHKKAHFSLHISDRIGSSDDALGELSSVKCESCPPFSPSVAAG